MTDLPETPPERDHELLLGMAARLARIEATQARVEERLEDRLRVIEARERGLRSVADDLAGVAMKLSASRVLAAVAPTPVRAFAVVLFAFLGGFLAETMRAWAGH